MRWLTRGDRRTSTGKDARIKSFFDHHNCPTGHINPSGQPGVNDVEQYNIPVNDDADYIDSADNVKFNVTFGDDTTNHHAHGSAESNHFTCHREGWQ